MADEPNAHLDGGQAGSEPQLQPDAGDAVPSVEPSAALQGAESRDTVPLNVPATPEGYLDALPDGLVIGDLDRPLLDEFTKVAHEINAPPDMVARFVDWHFRNGEKSAAEQARYDELDLEDSMQVLAQEWGPDAEKKTQAARDLIKTMPESLAHDVLAARTRDGTALGNNPLFILWLHNHLGKALTAAARPSGDGGNPAQSLGSERAQIEALMGNRNSAYWKGPKAEQLQQRYQDIIEAELTAGLRR